MIKNSWYKLVIRLRFVFRPIQFVAIVNIHLAGLKDRFFQTKRLFACKENIRESFDEMHRTKILPIWKLCLKSNQIVEFDVI